ncbi:MAG: acyltransferase [Bacteroidales bacterium]|nr:acyltransferase [Bacteroidales bacterium]
MLKDTKFDEIRPYYDEEIADAMHRIAENELFYPVSAYIYPENDVDFVRNELKKCRTIDEFQSKFMSKANEEIIKRSIRKFTFGGLEALDTEKKYLFVSNHRDIVLDAMLFQYILWQKGHKTSQITFGNNLMSSHFVIDIGRSNKMFKVIRGGNMKDFYRNSLLLSQYIAHTLHTNNESVWISQRNGRTKDGIDATDQGIIKMFYMFSPENAVESLASLNLVPVSISYFWETNDRMKAHERCISALNGSYKKADGEDLRSILEGISQYKGDVHIQCGKIITEKDLLPLADLPNNKFNAAVASLIDKEIRNNYKLFPTNFIAFDLRNGSDAYENVRYSLEEKALFLQRMNGFVADYGENRKLFEEKFIDIYANPVLNCL